MFRLIYVYNTFLYLGMLALWLLAFFHIIAMSQYGLLFPQHCGLGGALGGLAVVGGGSGPWIGPFGRDPPVSVVGVGCIASLAT